MDRIDTLIEKINEILIKNGGDIYDPRVKELMHEAFHDMYKGMNAA